MGDTQAAREAEDPGCRLRLLLAGCGVQAKPLSF